MLRRVESRPGRRGAVVRVGANKTRGGYAVARLGDPSARLVVEVDATPVARASATCWVRAASWFRRRCRSLRWCHHSSAGRGLRGYGAACGAGGGTAGEGFRRASRGRRGPSGGIEEIEAMEAREAIEARGRRLKYCPPSPPLGRLVLHTLNEAATAPAVSFMCRAAATQLPAPSGGKACCWGACGPSLVSVVSLGHSSWASPRHPRRWGGVRRARWGRAEGIDVVRAR